MNKEQLYQLFQLNSNSQAPSFVIYSTELTERLSYTCNFIFQHVLNCNYKLTSDLKTFNESKELKINYSSNVLENAFKIEPHKLLFETDIDQNHIPTHIAKNDLVYFYPNETKCDLGYDLFSSVFYFISRYQEWQPFDKDRHYRFEASNSIQFHLKQHLKPLIDIWVNEFKLKLQQFFGSIQFTQKKFVYTSTIDVDNLFAYKNKGQKRTIAGALKDIYLLDLKNLKRRLQVVKGKLADPFDVYEQLNTISKQSGVPLFYFFLQRTGTEFDRTIDPHSGAFEPVFEQLKKDKIEFGIHPSYNAHINEKLMKEEFDCIKQHSHSTINISRQHYLRFDIAKTPELLIKNDVVADFTMGFASSPGYRAATFTPFCYFDLKNNKATDLLMIPFVVMDGVYFNYSQIPALEAQEQMIELATQAKQLNGIFVSVFHERTMDEALYPGFKDLYLNLHERLKAST